MKKLLLNRASYACLLLFASYLYGCTSLSDKLMVRPGGDDNGQRIYYVRTGEKHLRSCHPSGLCPQQPLCSICVSESVWREGATEQLLQEKEGAEATNNAPNQNKEK